MIQYEYVMSLCIQQNKTKEMLIPKSISFLKSLFITISFIFTLITCKAQQKYQIQQKVTFSAELNYVNTKSSISLYHFNDTNSSIRINDELFKLILDYVEPTTYQLKQIKENVGEEPYKLLLEQIIFSNLFSKAYQILGKLEDLRRTIYLINEIGFSESYNSNTRMLKVLWQNIHSISVLSINLMNNDFDDSNEILLILKGHYNDFIMNFKVLEENRYVKKLVNYSFKSTEEQKQLWINVIKSIREEYPVISISMNNYLKNNYNNFRDIASLINQNYPETINILNTKE